MLPPFTFVWSLGSIVSVTHYLVIDVQVQDAMVEECLAAEFLEVGKRGWRLSNGASAMFRAIEGPLRRLLQLVNMIR